MKTINILFQSQVFEIDQKADPQEEVNTNEGTLNTKKCYIMVLVVTSPGFMVNFYFM